MLLYGAICRGLLSGKMTSDTTFQGDDIRKVDPKFNEERFSQYLDAVDRLDKFAQENYGKRVIHLALRWVLDKARDHIALWGARRPSQLEPVNELYKDAFHDKEKILADTIKDPVGPEFMAPPVKNPNV